MFNIEANNQFNHTPLREQLKFEIDLFVEEHNNVCHFSTKGVNGKLIVALQELNLVNSSSQLKVNNKPK